MAKQLAIIVGHTQRAPGARMAGADKVYEYQWNKDLAERMMRAAACLTGFEAAIFTRDKGGLSGAYGGAKDWGADAAIELHFNAASPAATGSETLYVTDPSKPFAQQVHKAIIDCLGLRDRGLKTPREASGGRGERNLKQMGARPSILIEPFFGSNLQDAATANERKQALADAMIEAAASYLKKPFDNGDDAEWTVCADALNVRGGPGTSYDKLDWGPLRSGGKVSLIQRFDDWFLIETKQGKTGFVHSAFLN